MGGSITAAALVTMLDRRTIFQQSMLAGSMTLSHPAVAQFMQTHSAAQLSALVQQQSTTLAYADVLLVSGLIAAALAPLLFLLPRKKAV